MDLPATVTRKDIDEVLNVLDVMMTRINKRFSTVKTILADTKKQLQNILNQLNHIERRLEISEDERFIMGH